MRFPAFREIASLFSGPASRLTIERSASLPVCPAAWELESGACCINSSSTRRAVRALGGGTAPASYAELRLRPHAELSRARLDAMRRVAWANLGVREAAADTVALPADLRFTARNWSWPS